MSCFEPLLALAEPAQQPGDGQRAGERGASAAALPCSFRAPAADVDGASQKEQRIHMHLPIAASQRLSE